MKQFLCLLGFLCLITSGYGQIFQSKKYGYRYYSPPREASRTFLGTRVGNIPLGKMINYKDSTATLSDFDGKLVILDFWFTTCGSCLDKFPEETAIQKKYKKQLQIIPVTYEPKPIVEKFLQNWNKNHKEKLRFPFIVHDTLLEMQFQNIYCPYYVFIQPDGHISAITGPDLISKNTIKTALKETRRINKRLKLYKSRYQNVQDPKDFKDPKRFYRDFNIETKYKPYRE